jgi:hypothetical protein
VILIGLAGPLYAGKRSVALYLRARHAFERVYFFQNLCGRLRTSNAPGIVFDDMRFDYEAIAIRAAGGQIWLLQRPGYLTRTGDPVIGITPRDTDRGIVNDGTLEALCARVDALLIALHP